MAVANANKFWLGVSKWSVLNGDVAFGCSEFVQTINEISSNIPYYAAGSFAHPIVPKFDQLYLTVAIQSNKVGQLDPSTNFNVRYDALRKGVNTEYVNFYYDDRKYKMNVITASMNAAQYSSNMLTTYSLFKNKNLYKILDVYITDIKVDESVGYTFNLKIRYLEKK